ncbi:MAG: protein kinase, partial [Pyrinomonadaceae bacterium]|nr:protein kinase [Pyrinomonadaceae bacterium]
MKRKEYQRIKKIFQEAVEMTPDDRDAFLAEKCRSNDALRNELERLLESEDFQFLEEPAVAQVAEAVVEEEMENRSATDFFDSENNDQFGHFTIISKIGKGGMGEVYLAEDRKLNRKIALKLMPARLIPDKDRLKRFEQEAFAVSSLNHPYILTIHDIGEYNNAHYISTEFVEGETLGEFCASNKKLDLTKILDLVIQCASALSAAHEAGIIHRDIKPENIMVRSDGYIKILDFGVAKLTGKHRSTDIEEESTGRLKVNTPTGDVIGTGPYMSPEQAKGKEIDERTDIWSLGVVLYEMLSGEKPFKGESPTDTIAEIIHEPPIPINRYVSTLPSELEWLVTKTLRKDLDGRYQTARELQADLEKIKQKIQFENELERSGAPDREPDVPGEHPVLDGQASKDSSASEPMTGKTARTWLKAGNLLGRAKTRKIGVLVLFAVLLTAMTAAGYYFLFWSKNPVITDKDVILLIDFENKSGEEIFDGTLKQGLIIQLQQSPYLSIFPEKGVRETLKLMRISPDDPVTREIGTEICQRNGLKALIAGSIVRFDKKYSLTLEAVNSQTGQIIAITQSEADGKDRVLPALSEAATQMRQKLGESLTLIEKFDKPLGLATTSSLEALKAASMGVHQQNSGNRQEAIVLLKRAVEIDPEFANAYSLLGRMYDKSGQAEQARDAIKKAYELREKSSEIEKLLIEQAFHEYIFGDIHKSIDLLN